MITESDLLPCVQIGNYKWICLVGDREKVRKQKWWCVRLLPRNVLRVLGLIWKTNIDQDLFQLCWPWNALSFPWRVDLDLKIAHMDAQTLMFWNLHCVPCSRVRNQSWEFQFQLDRQVQRADGNLPRYHLSFPPKRAQECILYLKLKAHELQQDFVFEQRQYQPIHCLFTQHNCDSDGHAIPLFAPFLFQWSLTWPLQLAWFVDWKHRNPTKAAMKFLRTSHQQGVKQKSAMCLTSRFSVGDNKKQRQCQFLCCEPVLRHTRPPQHLPLFLLYKVQCYPDNSNTRRTALHKNTKQKR